ncbi:MAG: hypothetical protein ACQETE_01570 [Bacteroidota bacterium]
MSLSTEALQHIIERYGLGKSVTTFQQTVTLKADAGEKQQLMQKREGRCGWIVENDSDGNMYVLLEDRVCSKTTKSLTIGPGEMVTVDGIIGNYDGVVTYASDLDGSATVTELFYAD